MEEGKKERAGVEEIKLFLDIKRGYSYGIRAGYSRLGDLLRGLRIKKRLKVLEVAEEAQVSSGTISFVENSRRLPSLGVLVRVLKALGYELLVVEEGVRVYPEEVEDE